MRILAIDTTVVGGSIALTDGELLVAQEQQGAVGTHSERIISSIEHLLRVSSWDRNSIEAVCVAIGPGSFTGLRIGIAVAKGFAMALGRPIAGASSLKSLALNAKGFSGTVVGLIDARRGEIFAGAWKVDAEGQMTESMGECVDSPAAIAERLKRIDGDLMLVGDGAIAYGELLRREIGQKAHIATGSQARPQAANLVTLLLERLSTAGGDDVAALAPNYIRHSDAEIGFMGKK